MKFSFLSPTSNAISALKAIGVGMLIGSVTLSGYFAYRHYTHLINSRTSLQIANKALVLDASKLEQSIKTQSNSIDALKRTIASRDETFTLLQGEISQLEQERKKQEDETKNAIKKYENILATSLCANERMPDDIIRLQRTRTKEFNARFHGG
ncbi:MAG: hypothetical protein ACRC6N_11065 [Plesiomonas sp.]|uniref:hypothetical protein n=1 Tax=Plesiomonas sp. TaxID=2486279 RepID=UPI003F321423